MRARLALPAVPLLAIVLAGCTGRPDMAPLAFDRMTRQQRYNPYGRSDFFANGAVNQVPPDGTVPREERLGPPLLTRGYEGNHMAPRIQVPVTLALVQTGQKHFDIYCAACHGVLGNGESPVAQSMQLRKPPSLLSEKVRSAPPGYIFRVITEGRGLMPSYAPQLTVDERWGVVAYVKALEVSQAAEVDRLPADQQQSVLAQLAGKGGK